MFAYLSLSLYTVLFCSWKWVLVALVWIISLLDGSSQSSAKLVDYWTLVSRLFNRLHDCMHPIKLTLSWSIVVKRCSDCCPDGLGALFLQTVSESLFLPLFPPQITVCPLVHGAWTGLLSDYRTSPDLTMLPLLSCFKELIIQVGTVGFLAWSCFKEKPIGILKNLTKGLHFLWYHPPSSS